MILLIIGESIFKLSMKHVDFYIVKLPISFASLICSILNNQKKNIVSSDYEIDVVLNVLNFSYKFLVGKRVVYVCAIHFSRHWFMKKSPCKRSSLFPLLGRLCVKRLSRSWLLTELELPVSLLFLMMTIMQLFLIDFMKWPSVALKTCPPLEMKKKMMMLLNMLVTITLLLCLNDLLYLFSFGSLIFSVYFFS